MSVIINLYDLGNKIKKYRKRRDITQQELAEMLGVSTKTISNWERGLVIPDIESVVLYCQKMGESLDALYDINNGITGYIDNINISDKAKLKELADLINSFTLVKRNILINELVRIAKMTKDIKERN